MNLQQSTTDTAQRSRRGTFHQPRALYVVSAFELAERFSYFGMLAILVYYVYFSAGEGGLGLSQGLATALVGGYTGGIYLFTVVGGWVADRVLGAARTLVVGAVIVLAGHVTLAFLPGLSGLLIGMLLVAAGSGCTKATTASVVGTLYQAGSSERIIGFTLFYLSLNLGALLGGLSVAWIQQSWGFHAGFAAAAAGMVVGLIIYLPGRRTLPAEAIAPPAPAPAPVVARAVALALGIAVVLCVAFATGAIRLEDTSTVVAVLGALIATTYFVVMRRSTAASPEEFRTVVRYIPILVASTVLVALWMQLYIAVAVHADARIDRHFLGMEIPPSAVAASGAAFAILLTPLVNAMWTRLGSRQPGTAAKYAIAYVILGACYLALGTTASIEELQLPFIAMLGIVGGFFLADLVASPAGLAYATATAPHQFRTQLVSVHSMSYAVGAALAGVTAQWYSPDGNAGGYFLGLAVVSLLGAAAMFVLRRIVVDGRALTAATQAITE